MVADLGDADARAKVGRLDEQRIGQLRLDRADDVRLVGLPRVPPDDDPVGHAQAARPEQDLHDRLVHADGGGQHAAPHVGDVGELEQSLNGAVLAVRAVQHGEDHVQREARHGRRRFCIVGPRRSPIDENQRVVAGAWRQDDVAAGARPRGLAAHLVDHVGGRGRRRRTIGQQPPPVLLDADGHRFVALAIEIREDGSRRRQRHFVLAGTATVQHADAKTFHARLASAPLHRPVRSRLIIG